MFLFDSGLHPVPAGVWVSRGHMPFSASQTSGNLWIPEPMCHQFYLPRCELCRHRRCSIPPTELVAFPPAVSPFCPLLPHSPSLQIGHKGSVWTSCSLFSLNLNGYQILWILKPISLFTRSNSHRIHCPQSCPPIPSSALLILVFLKHRWLGMGLHQVSLTVFTPAGPVLLALSQLR